MVKKVEVVNKKKEKEVVDKKVVTPSPAAPVNKFVHIEPPSYGISGREGALEANEVYDDADIASALEAGFIAQALQKHKEKVAPETHPDFDGEHCVECDVLIPKVRLDMGKVRCVDCQSALEKANKIHGRY